MIRLAIGPGMLLLCLLLGGASAAGYVANLILQLAALPIIGWALWPVLQTRPLPTRAIGSALALLAAMVAIGLLQLVPLPPSLWALLPGRDTIAAGYRLLGLPLPWLPLTLAPDKAIASLLWLLPAIAVFLAISLRGAFRARWIGAVLVLVTLVSIMLGALQVVGDGSAYLYQVTNYGHAVGFFSNANHNATLMLVCIPFLAAVQSRLLAEGRSTRSRSAIRLLVAAAYAVILVGLLINASLAGIGLGVPVALSSWLVFGRHRPAVRTALTGVAALISAATLVAIAVGPFGNNLFGVQHKNIELSRQTSFALTLRAARDYLPIGSGIGSFQPIYRTQEPLASVTATYMNHAHSDWLELLLETGLVGIALAGAFLIWWVLRLRAIWQSEEPEVFAQAAAIASAAILLHSIVDYPLRTAALSAVFAMCIALMAGARPYAPRQRGTPAARHVTL